MPNANYLINALAEDDKEEANSAFEAMIQDRLADHLEVRKVELASTIFDDLQEGKKLRASEKTHQVVFTVPGEGKQHQYFHVHADDEDHAREQLMDAEPKAKIHKVVKLREATSAERQYIRQVAAVGRAYMKDGKPAKRSIHQGELKAHARKNLKKLGYDTVQYHADVLKQVRQNLKAQGKLPGLRKEEALDEVIQGGSKNASAAPSNAALNRNVMMNIRKAVQMLRLKGVNPTAAAAGHRDFGKLAAKNPKAPGYMLMRKLQANKASNLQSLTQAGVPLGSALEANPAEFGTALQRIKRFK